MNRLRKTLARLVQRGRTPQTCDACAFVEFFRSNGDGQAARLQAFCRCPDGPFTNRPIPRARHCAAWQLAAKPSPKPSVGDPTLTV